MTVDDTAHRRVAHLGQIVQPNRAMAAASRSVQLAYRHSVSQVHSGCGLCGRHVQVEHLHERHQARAQLGAVLALARALPLILLPWGVNGVSQRRSAAAGLKR